MKSDIKLCKNRREFLTLARRLAATPTFFFLIGWTKGSNVANHASSKNHHIDFENVLIIDKGNYRHLKTLETWHTVNTQVDAENN